MRKAELVKHPLRKYGTLFSDDLGIDLVQNTPSQLFRGPCAALLSSARIPHGTAMKAAKALTDAGMATARSLAEALWKERVGVLGDAGYGRFDESTSRVLGETTLASARPLGLRDTAKDLAKLVDQDRLATLAAAPVRADFAGTTVRDLELHGMEAAGR